MYVSIPGIDDDEWTDEELAEYRRETADWQPRPWENKMRLEIEGTTFSGHSTRTTLGNTLRSIAYMFYYATLAGIDEPWNSNELAIVASGDDTVAWIVPQRAKALQASILANTHRKSEEIAISLAQVVKTAPIGDFSDVDFCSKKSFT